MELQYLVTPVLITEHQWGISGIETPVGGPEESGNEQVIDVAPSDRTYSKKIEPWYFC